jgi:DNA-binding NarL/FixJ family response regulator
MPISIAIVDDKPMLIKSLVENLSMFEEIKILFVATSGEEALEKLTGIVPQVMLLDIEMPGMGGILTAEKIHQIFPEVKVLMLTVFDQENNIFEAILAGATGYLLKEEKPTKIVSAIQEAMEGGAPMSPIIARKALQMLKNQYAANSNQIPDNYGLTTREIEVLKLMSEGLSYQPIAEKLFISPKTVRNHIENIYKKLQVNSKVDAVKIGLKNKWF